MHLKHVFQKGDFVSTSKATKFTDENHDSSEILATQD